MSWNPNQGQEPNQPSQPNSGDYIPPTQYAEPYGGNVPPPPGADPYSGQQSGYGQQQGYQQNPYQQGGYQQAYAAPQPGIATPLGHSSIGLEPNVAAGLGYLVPIVGLIFFFMEKQSRFVRFHALQSIFLLIASVAVFFVYLILAVVAAAANSGVIFSLLFCVIGVAYLALFVGWLLGMIQGFMGKYFKLPLIGNLAERFAAAPGML